MSNKKHRSAADSSALSIVIIGLTIVIVGCFLGIRYLMDYGFYEKNDNGETAKIAAMQIYSVDDCAKAIDFYRTLNGVNKIAESYNSYDIYKENTSEENKKGDGGEDVFIVVDEVVDSEEMLNYKYYEDLFSVKKSNFYFWITDEYGGIKHDDAERRTRNTTNYSYKWAEKNAYYTGKTVFYDFDQSGKAEPLILNYAVVFEEVDENTVNGKEENTDENGLYRFANMCKETVEFFKKTVKENIDENGRYKIAEIKKETEKYLKNLIEGKNEVYVVANDRYKSAFEWIEIANSLKYFVFIVLFVAILIMVILLCIITINAGVTDPETGEIIPSSIDKIPLDLCTVAVIGFFAVAWMVMGLTTAADVEMVLNNLVVVITFVTFIMLLMSYLQTISVRVKMGKIYKNTVFYMIYRKFKRKTPRKVRKAFSDLSFFGKIILGISAYVIFEAAILIIMARIGIFGGNATEIFTMFLIVWGMTRLLIIPIFVLVAINLNYIREEGERLAGGILESGVTNKLSMPLFKAHGKNLDQIRKEINKAMEQELKSEKLRNELITNVSHDIKTPLTSIKSYVDFLQRDNLSEKERREYLEIVAKHTDKLAVLAKNLIEVSQITSGNIEVKREKTSLNIIIEQTIEEFALKLEQSELMPRVSMPEKEVFVMGDGEWLWRIFSNLLNNACKYAACGTDVEISLEENNGKAVIRIANISKSALNVEGDELFERFVRGDSSRHTEGNGLGLSIAKSLAELQGGSLDISVKGDTFAAVVVFDSIK